MTNLSIRTLDLPQLHAHLTRHAIGFDQMFNELHRTFATGKADSNYPPHNLVKIDDTHYAIELAVAGFENEEIDVELNDNVVTVKGERKREEDSDVEYLHKGISNRDFTRTFPLAEHIHVRGAAVKNGILRISLEQVIPDENKPKKIAISFAK
jgi:molecular chaperone IbpA